MWKLQSHAESQERQANDAGNDLDSAKWYDVQRDLASMRGAWQTLDTFLQVQETRLGCLESEVNKMTVLADKLEEGVAISSGVLRQIRRDARERQAGSK